MDRVSGSVFDKEWFKRAKVIVVFLIAVVALMAFFYAVDTYVISPLYRMGKEGFEETAPQEATPDIEKIMADRDAEFKEIVETDVDPAKESIASSGYPPAMYIPPWDQNVKQYGEMDMLDDGMSGSGSVLFNKCSKSCCAPQYPVPFAMETDKSLCSSGKEYVPNNYTCNDGWNDTGCLCLDKEQANFMAHRAGNV